MTKKVSSFDEIYQRACERKGSEQVLREHFPDGIRSAKQLAKIGDDRYLSAMTRAIFKAGFVWRVIDNKWPHFEEAFHQFDIEVCRFLSAEQEDKLCSNELIVRNRQKILTVRYNAQMMADVAEQHGSFAHFVAHWPDSDYIGLLDFLKKHGSRLGGNSCQYFLRAMGKDGFLLTGDVSRALINARVVDKAPTAKGERKKVQQAFNHWREESGENFAVISRTLAISIG